MKKMYSFTVMALLSVSLFSQNLLPNPGFENWTGEAPTGWYFQNGTGVQETTVKHGGNYAVKLTPEGVFGTVLAYPNSKPAVTSGKTYVFTAWYLINMPDTYFHFICRWYRSDGVTSLGELLQSPFSSGVAAEWRQYTWEATAPAEAAYADIAPGVIVLKSTLAGEYGYVDDVSMTEKDATGVSGTEAYGSRVQMNTLVDKELTLTLPARATVNVYTVAGKLVSSHRLSSGGSIDMSAAPKGNYLVTVTDGVNRITRKIMKR